MNTRNLLPDEAQPVNLQGEMTREERQARWDMECDLIVHLATTAADLVNDDNALALLRLVNDIRWEVEPRIPLDLLKEFVALYDIDDDNDMVPPYTTALDYCRRFVEFVRRCREEEDAEVVAAAVRPE